MSKWMEMVNLRNGVVIPDAVQWRSGMPSLETATREFLIFTLLKLCKFLNDGKEKKFRKSREGIIVYQ